VRVAEIEIDSAQLDQYKAAVKEQIEAAVLLEPGVLVLYSVAEKEDPARVFVFEMYADVGARRAHGSFQRIRDYHAGHGEIPQASGHGAYPPRR
jgi:quinol monooxygenase YgiN